MQSALWITCDLWWPVAGQHSTAPVGVEWSSMRHWITGELGSVCHGVSTPGSPDQGKNQQHRTGQLLSVWFGGRHCSSHVKSDHLFQLGPDSVLENANWIYYFDYYWYIYIYIIINICGSLNIIIELIRQQIHESSPEAAFALRVAGSRWCLSGTLGAQLGAAW